MNEKEFQIGERKFQLNKIDALKQFHILRRVGPILSELAPALKEIQPSKKKSKESESLDAVARIATPVLNGLSKLSDTDADFVLYGLLSSVEMQQLGNWMRVSNNGMLMVQDLELPQLLQLAGRAFVYNMSGFFSGLPAQ